MGSASWHFDLGASVLKEGGTRFRVWAPKAEKVSLLLLSGKAVGTLAMEKEEKGYFSITVHGVGDGDRYMYQLDDGPAHPDPASRYQPSGVDEASQVVDPALFTWQDGAWNGIPLQEYRIYEIHVGTFTREGTFEAVIQHLDYLLDLGITAIEIMPVSQCPGQRNWGYDGVNPYAPQNNYGGPDGMKRLIDACHRKGLAVILDVVYNHLGPEGNHFPEFGDYFTGKYRTPWGGAINFDGPDSDQVLEFFFNNAMYWIHEFHMDALRLDAVDWIFDQTPQPFLQRLSDAVRLLRQNHGKEVYLFAENDTNDPRLTNSPELCGLGIDTQWCDNFHHALRTLLTGETTGYYEDFGQFGQMVKAYQQGFVYTGEYSRYRRRRHGGPIKEPRGTNFVVFSQNHDQVGNRKCGDRLSEKQQVDKLLLAAAVVILSPYIPLLFMGEEYGERAPFHYFIDHSDQELIQAVFKGKHEEHASGVCEGEIPDPSAESTFLESKLNLGLRKEGEHAMILAFYRQLFALRSRLPALHIIPRDRIEIEGHPQQRVLSIRREADGNGALCLFSFSNMQEQLTLTLPKGNWEKVLDSSDQKWRGPGEVSPGVIKVSEPAAANSITVNPFNVLVYASNTGG